MIVAASTNLKGSDSLRALFLPEIPALLGDPASRAVGGDLSKCPVFSVFGSKPFSIWPAAGRRFGCTRISKWCVAGSRLEQGALPKVEWFRGIGEYQIDWGPHLRIYLAKDGLKIIILFGGVTKKRPQQDVDQAVALWDDCKRRKVSTQERIRTWH